MILYDKNVKAVMDFLESENYSASVVSQHRICYREFRRYLSENSLTYSKDVGDVWINSHKTLWNYATVTGYSHCLDQLEDVYHSGMVSPDHLGPRKAPYSMLKDRLKEELDEYLLFSSSSGDTDLVSTQRRICCARFMLYLQDKGINSLTEVDYPTVLSFHNDDYHSSRKSKDVYEDEIRALLRYYAGRGKCSIGLSLILNKLLIHQVITNGDFLMDKDERFIGADTLEWEQILNFLDMLKKVGYAGTVLKCSKHVLTLMYIFFDMHRLQFCTDTAWLWFDMVKSLLQTNWKQARRSLSQFLIFRETGTIITATTGDPNAKTGIDLLPEWCRIQLEAFLNLLSREGRADSTINMYRSSIVRFCRYLDSIGIDSFDKVTADTLSSFNLQDRHTTAEGKCAYNCRIRSFLIYLAEEKVINNWYLYKALPSLSAPKTRIVETLDDNEVQMIWGRQNSDASPIYIRDYAIVCLGLGMGMRSSDIVNLRFGDIDWNKQCIHFIQQKTGKAVVLPFPNNVGNAIYRYLKKARPQSTSAYIFISHRMPYDKLDRNVCRKALQRVLPERGESGGGFHVTRRTFATNLLRNNTKVSLISDSLGHRTDTTVLKYLSLDEERMRLCPLSLHDTGITMEGGVFNA